jgi:hypothetical protein
MNFIKKPIFALSTLIIVSSAYILGWTNLFVVEKIIIDSNDKKVVQDVMSKIKQQPPVVELGQPLARVDRREIATRLREMLWIENIKLDRRIFSGELHLEIIPRNPIARLVPKDSTNVATIGFMDRDLEYFYLPREAVNRAISAGEWSQVPELAILRDSAELRQDVSELLSELQKSSLMVERVTAKDQLAISTKVSRQGRILDISWGSVKDLELKIEILNRLMELKANRNVKNVNLSNPVSPIVSR